MLFFNRFDKKSVSPPVKITVKSWYVSLYSSITPSISFKTPLTTPEWMDWFVESPISPLGISVSNNGKLAVKLWSEWYLSLIPGDIAPPR